MISQSARRGRAWRGAAIRSSPAILRTSASVGAAIRLTLSRSGKYQRIGGPAKSLGGSTLTHAMKPLTVSRFLHAFAEAVLDGRVVRAAMEIVFWMSRFA